MSCTIDLSNIEFTQTWCFTGGKTLHSGTTTVMRWENQVGDLGFDPDFFIVNTLACSTYLAAGNNASLIQLQVTCSLNPCCQAVGSAQPVGSWSTVAIANSTTHAGSINCPGTIIRIHARPQTCRMSLASVGAGSTSSGKVGGSDTLLTDALNLWANGVNFMMVGSFIKLRKWCVGPRSLSLNWMQDITQVCIFDRSNYSITWPYQKAFQMAPKDADYLVIRSTERGYSSGNSGPPIAPYIGTFALTLNGINQLCGAIASTLLNCGENYGAVAFMPVGIVLPIRLSNPIVNATLQSLSTAPTTDDPPFVVQASTLQDTIIIELIKLIP